MHALIETQLQQPLSMVDGVANVEIIGPAEARVEINLSQELINTHHVDMLTLIQQLQRDNFALSSGWILPEQPEALRAVGLQVQLARADPEPPHRGHCRAAGLADIAQIEYTTPEPDHVYRVDATPASASSFNKQSLANTVEVTDVVIDLLENDLMQRPQLANLRGHIFLNLADHIKASLRQLRLSGLWVASSRRWCSSSSCAGVRITAVITCAIPTVDPHQHDGHLLPWVDAERRDHDGTHHRPRHGSSTTPLSSSSPSMPAGCRATTPTRQACAGQAKSAWRSPSRR